MRAIGDRVRLTAARGGWSGYIASMRGGPAGEPLYEVRSSGYYHEAMQWVQEADIEQELEAASFAEGDPVRVGRSAGHIETDHGDGTYTVVVYVEVNRHMTVERRHRVPAWWLATEG